jgi:protease I
MAQELSGRRVAVLATDGVEEVEYTQPRDAVEAAGARVELVAPHSGHIQAMQHMDKGSAYRVERTLDEASPDQYDALLLPGGVANPDQLRTDPRAVSFVRSFVQSGKPVGAICHAPWLLVEADVVRGRTVTSWPSLRTDITNAGGTWVDETVHTDRGLVTSRKPADLPDFTKKVVEEFAEGRHTR